MHTDTRAFYTLLRLPGPVQAVFEERLREKLPLRAERVLHRIRETRGGELNDSRFRVRMRGEGLYAQTLHQLFSSTARRLGLKTSEPMEADGDKETPFRRPMKSGTQLSFF